ncbi:MAG: PEP/pyruvate-binding domain-containing protein [Acidimicrobiales bacterium]
MASSPYVLWFDDLGRESCSLVGGKNAGLGEMMRNGVRVPMGFALTTEAYDAFVEHAGLRPCIHRALEGLDPHEPDGLDAASAEIRSRIEEVAFPNSIEEALGASYAALGTRLGTSLPPVAVRSSATAEDTAEASFAGQQETYLWVEGLESLALHARRCWSSLYTAQAISYRAEMGFPPGSASMSVGVQSMVDARAAGVMFTVSPVSGDRSKIVLEASWGLGLGVVGGEVTPDNYWVDKVTLGILRRSVCRKHLKYVADPRAGGVACVEVPLHEQEVPCLSDEEVTELARLGKQLEVSYGAALDIEWAIDARLPFPEAVVMLQCRPETVWSNRPVEPVAHVAASPVDYVLGAIMPHARSSKS